MTTSHEAIFNAINGVHRDPFLSLNAANAVLDALERVGMVIVPAGSEPNHQGGGVTDPTHTCLREGRAVNTDPVVAVIAEALLGCDNNHPTYGTPKFAYRQAEVAAAAVREAGLAVVQLPDANPNGVRRHPSWRVVVDGEPEDVYVRKDTDVEPEIEVVVSGVVSLTVGESRDLAAALLAAAVVVEGEQ